MTIDSMIERRKLRRKVEGIAAALLPFQSDGTVAVEAFQRHLVATVRAGLMNAMNMDTGYVNYLGDAEKCDVLRWTREALGTGVAFVAGAYIEGQSGGVVALYRREMGRGGGGGGGGGVFLSGGVCGEAAGGRSSGGRASFSRVSQ